MNVYVHYLYRSDGDMHDAKHYLIGIYMSSLPSISQVIQKGKKRTRRDV
jgi:hypothetical protein